MALGLLLEARLGRVVVARRVLGALFHFLELDAAVERLGVLGVDDRLLSRHVELHDLGGWHQAHRDVSLARRVVPEVDAEGPIAVVDNLSGDEQIELDGLDIGMEVSPAEHLFEFPRLHHGPPFGPGSGILDLRGVPQPVPQVPFCVGFRCVIVQVQGRGVLLPAQSLRQEPTDGQVLGAFCPYVL